MPDASDKSPGPDQQVLCDPDVVELVVSDTRTQHQAVCECGWKGPVRTYYGECIPDADSHALEGIR